MLKQFMIVFLIMFLSLTLIMCTGEQKPETKSDTNQTKVTKEELIDCPGCNMKMEKSKMVAHVVEGDTTYFCGEGCKDHYLAKQEKKSM